MHKKFTRKVFKNFSKKSAQVPSKVQRSSPKVVLFLSQHSIESRPNSVAKLHHSSDELIAKDQKLRGKFPWIFRQQADKVLSKFGKSLDKSPI